MKILLISGTNRKPSLSYEIAVHYKDLLKRYGVESDVISLADLPGDFAFSALYENSGKNEIFNIFREQILEYQKFVFIVPEYNGSFPGVLKTFIDGLKYPGSFKGKKAAMVGLSSGVQGGALALSHLNDIFSYLGMHVLGNRVKLMHIEKNMTEGKIDNKLFNELLELQVKEFINF